MDMTKNLKKKNRRSTLKYPGLDPSVNLITRQDEILVDYVHKLNDKEKEFLNSFNEEWVNANFSHKGEKLYTSKKDKKACYDRNNARNRCIYTKAKASEHLDYIEDLKVNKYQSSEMFGKAEEDEKTSALEQVHDLNNSDDDSSN